MSRAGVREWLLSEEAWPDLPFARKPVRRPLDYPLRVAEVLHARLTRRNPPPPAWRRRAILDWQVIGSGPGPQASPSRLVLFGVIGAWNEDDIVYATVRNLFVQGCDRVFVIDDGSDDNTADEATDGGAAVIPVHSDGTYREAVRSTRIGAVITHQTQQAGGDVWWLVADADEFPRGHGGRTVRDVIADLPGWVDMVGSRVIEHLPHPGATYTRRTHPVEAFPLAHAYCSPYCRLGHWKHQLFRTRVPGDLKPLPGQHTLTGPEGRRVREWPHDILMHHLPLRGHEHTAARLRSAAQPDGRYARSPDTFTRWRLTQRLRALGLLYQGRTSEVPNGFAGEPVNGVYLADWRTLVPATEGVLERLS